MSYSLKEVEYQMNDFIVDLLICFDKKVNKNIIHNI